MHTMNTVSREHANTFTRNTQQTFRGQMHKLTLIYYEMQPGSLHAPQAQR